MKITQFEATGLEQVETYLRERETVRLTEADLRLLLKTVNISFIYEDINRLQSMLICECRDSYVQQSQRYVAVGREDYSLPELEAADERKARALIEEMFSLYEEMSQKVAGEIKGRPRPEQYVHQIPIEDARYILPLLVKTNICTALAGEKLLDLFRLFEDVRYGSLFTDVVKALQTVLPPRLFRLLIDQCAVLPDPDLSDCFYGQYFDRINEKEPMVLLEHFGQADQKAGFGALTSTSKLTPTQQISRWGEEAPQKAAGVVERVLGYGHDSIAEQVRTTFGMMCSLVTYHQQERHRLTENVREDLAKIIFDTERPVKVPESIQKSMFHDAFLELMHEIKSLRLEFAKKYGMETAFWFLMNCDQIKLILSANARADRQMLCERTCLNAQWEIRGLAVAKLKKLRSLSAVLYERALPSCVYGACKEGKMTCGKALEVREMFAKI